MASATSSGSSFFTARPASTPAPSSVFTSAGLSATGLLISVTVSERNRHEESLEHAKTQLEQRISERTRELEGRIEKQERAEQALRDLSVRLLRSRPHKVPMMARAHFFAGA